MFSQPHQFRSLLMRRSVNSDVFLVSGKHPQRCPKVFPESGAVCGLKQLAQPSEQSKSGGPGRDDVAERDRVEVILHRPSRARNKNPPALFAGHCYHLHQDRRDSGLLEQIVAPDVARRRFSSVFRHGTCCWLFEAVLRWSAAPVNSVVRRELARENLCYRKRKRKQTSV